MNEDFKKVKLFFDESVKMMKRVVKQSCLLPTEESDLVYMKTFPDYVKGIENLNKSIQCSIRALPKALDCIPKWPPLLKQDDFKSEDSDKQLMETIIDVNDYIAELFEKTLESAVRGDSLDSIANNANVTIEKQLLDKYNLSKNIAQTNVTSFKNILKNESCQIAKPQIQWSKRLKNDYSPFRPRLETKPHALIPLDMPKEEFFKICDNERIIQLYDKYKYFWSFYLNSNSHPYVYEIYQQQHNIKEFRKKYKKKIREARPLDKDFHYIDSVDQLNDFVKFITSSNIKEIACDLEAHSMRSYLGFVCLMQLSTRKEDFIIDTIALHDCLSVLNVLFANPNVLKIFHGATCDIKWLQRDFNIYVVNMFDTYMASKRLPFPRRNLAYLLQHYCNVDTDKSFQKADWRLRPLTADMIKYARIDTHYLHYIYDRLVADLLDCDQNKGDVLLSVLKDCRDVSLNVYEKPPEASIALLKFKEKFSRNMSYAKVCCLEELFLWRETIAQKHDESPEYVLPQHMLLELANRLPRDKEGIIAFCNPLPSLLSENLSHVCKIIKSSYDDEVNLKSVEPPLSAQNLKDTTKKSLSKFLNVYDGDLETTGKISSCYLSSNSNQNSLQINNAEKSYPPVKDSDHFLCLKRQVVCGSKLAHDIRNSFVNFHSLYKRSRLDK